MISLFLFNRESHSSRNDETVPCYMLPRRYPQMDANPSNGGERDNALRGILQDLWPLDEIDPSTQKFPCCLVWTPLPVISWLAPFVGHVGICREDGTIVDFSGDSMIHFGQLFYGTVAKYYQVDRQQVCAHDCFYPFQNPTRSP